VADVKLLRGQGGGLNEEAMRVVRLMPKWEPGTRKGKPVRVLFNMPVSFKLGSNIFGIDFRRESGQTK
jgi:protein TonB